MIKLTIPGQPTGKGRPRLGKGNVYTPRETVNYEDLVRKTYIIGNYGKQLEGQLCMRIKAYYEIPKTASKNMIQGMTTGLIRPTKKPDIDNVIKIIADSLNGLAYRDDSQIVGIQAEKWYSTEPRVEVEIEEIGV
jgi:Holliday junction resolvase RusA-like endonuclease